MRKLTILLLSCAIAASAGQPMTLDDCMRYALDRHFDVRSAAVDYSDSRLDYHRSKAAFLPTAGGSISAQYSFGRSIDPGTNTYDNVKTFNNSYGLNLFWTLFSGGQLVNDFREARSRKQLSESAMQSRRDEVAVAVMDAFVNYVYYRELSGIMSEKLAESGGALEKMRRMKSLGMKSAVDLSQAESQYAEDDYNLTNATSMLRQSYLTLKNAMNYPVGDSLEVVAPDSVLSDVPMSGVAETVEFASVHNPLMRQAALNVDIARHAHRGAKGLLFPTITLNAGISDHYYRRFGSSDNKPFKEQMDVNFGQYVGVSVSIPIFGGLSRTTTVQKARNRRVAAEIDYERKRYELQTGVEQAVLDRDNFAKEAEKLRRKSESDSVAYQLAKRKYEEGLMNILDMRQLANAWFASQAELLRCDLLFDVKRRLVEYYRTNNLFQK